MSKERTELFRIMAIVIAALVYSVAAMAYLNNTFVSTSSFNLVCNKLDKIENKLDNIIDMHMTDSKRGKR